MKITCVSVAEMANNIRLHHTEKNKTYVISMHNLLHIRAPERRSGGRYPLIKSMASVWKVDPISRLHIFTLHRTKQNLRALI